MHGYFFHSLCRKFEKLYCAKSLSELSYNVYNFDSCIIIHFVQS